MYDFLEHISKTFTELSGWQTFFVILVILIFAVPIIYYRKYFGQILVNMANNFINKEPTESKRKVIEAKYHDIFNMIGIVKSKINSIDYTTDKVYDEAKSILIKIMINNQLEETRKALLCLINFDGIDEMDNQQLKYEMIRKLNKANDNYNNKTYLEFIELGISSKDSHFMLDEYSKFRNDVMEGFLDRVESICSNDVYATNFHRVSSSFEVVALGLHLIARESIYTCSQINGTYKKYLNILK